MENIAGIIAGLSAHKNTVAITLGGSRATGINDAQSDYDVYVYYSGKIESAFRKETLEKYCRHLETAVDYFEEEDDCILDNGTVVELIYRDFASIKNAVADLMYKPRASLGYTTCLLDNLVSSKILFDRDGAYGDLISGVSYPDELRAAIIKKNMEMLHGVIASYDAQILKAYDRKDMVSVNHRISAYLASYFDILFAVNKVFHPGEKRLIDLAKKKCKLLPDNFEKDIENLLDLRDIEKTLRSLYSNMKITTDTEL